MLAGVVRLLPNPGRRLLHGGYLAVETFFILSGFVLELSYDSAAWNRMVLRQDLVGRFARVYPVYLVSIAIVGSWLRTHTCWR